MQGKFGALVRHDFKRRKRANMLLSRNWRFAYALTVAIVVIGITTYGSRYDNIDFNYIWYFTIGLPFTVLGLSASRIAYEWKNGTEGWWLSLPISRFQLVASKFVATLVQAVLIFAVIYVAVAVLGVYTMLLQGNYQWSAAALFLNRGLCLSLLCFSVCPFSAAFGVLLGVIRQTRIRQILPLFWIVIGGIWWFLSSHKAHYLHVTSAGLKHDVMVSPTPLFYLLIGVSWVVAYIFIHFTAYLLDRQLDI